MNAITVRELNADVSKAIARVEAGETLEISRNNRVIAELRPSSGKHGVERERAAKTMAAILARGFELGGGPLTADDKYGDADL